jgi:hypothetical protein
MATDTINDEWLDTEQAAALTAGANSPSTLETYRARKSGGPIYYKFGHKVRYKRSDVEAWIETHCKRVPTSIKPLEQRAIR